MPHIKKAIPTSRAKNHAPVAPADLWERLDRELAKYTAEPPKGAFCTADYAERYRMSYSRSASHVARLMRSGLVKMVGHFGSKHTRYYMVTK